jgi:molybdopterin converting factor small subunit
VEFIHKHYGWLILEEDCNYHETVRLDGEPIAEVLDYMSGEIVTVRYYTSDKEATEEELQEDFLTNTLYGNLESDYGARYSEITGYLWTDDNLKVGGHDLREELESYAGKYLYMVVEIDQKAYQEKLERQRLNAIDSNKRMYARYLNDLIRYAKHIDNQKSLDDVIKDIVINWNKN